MTTVLGFDFGLKHIGVAVGQTVTASANALGHVSARDGTPDWQALDTLLAEWQPQDLVVGLPLNMDDSESDMSARARRFGRRLGARYSLPVAFHDERLTSAEARSLSEDEDARHAIAARLIVESWLGERLSGGS